MYVQCTHILLCMRLRSADSPQKIEKTLKTNITYYKIFYDLTIKHKKDRSHNVFIFKKCSISKL